VDRRQYFWVVFRGPAGYTLFLDYRVYWHCRLSNIGFDFAFARYACGSWGSQGQADAAIDPSQGPILITVEHEVDQKKSDEGRRTRLLVTNHPLNALRRAPAHEAGALAFQQVSARMCLRQERRGLPSRRLPILNLKNFP